LYVSSFQSFVIEPKLWELQIACIGIVLFACQHAFKEREPLPQFLPSARHALGLLERRVQECIRASAESDEVLGLSLVYTLAEHQIMGSIVEVVESLLALTGELFGTSVWLKQHSPFLVSTRHEDGDHGWYSIYSSKEEV
jgi:hypothetical protein